MLRLFGWATAIIVVVLYAAYDPDQGQTEEPVQAGLSEAEAAALDEHNLTMITTAWGLADCSSTYYFERTPLIGVWTVRGPLLLGDKSISVHRFDLETGGDIASALSALHEETGITHVSFPQAFEAAGRCAP